MDPSAYAPLAKPFAAGDEFERDAHCKAVDWIIGVAPKWDGIPLDT